MGLTLCFYSDIVIAYFDTRVENYFMAPIVYKYLRDVFIVETYNVDTPPDFLEYLINKDTMIRHSLLCK